jgi:hypothetical protein
MVSARGACWRAGRLRCDCGEMVGSALLLPFDDGDKGDELSSKVGAEVDERQWSTLVDNAWRKIAELRTDAEGSPRGFGGILSAPSMRGEGGEVTVAEEGGERG